MNLSMLNRLAWTQVHLYPFTLSIFPKDGFGRRLVVVRRWPWLVMPSEKRTLNLQNTTTGHLLKLPTDSIFEFRENIDARPPFLILKSQVFINALKVWIEPIGNWRPTKSYASVDHIWDAR